MDHISMAYIRGYHDAQLNKPNNNFMQYIRGYHDAQSNSFITRHITTGNNKSLEYYQGYQAGKLNKLDINSIEYIKGYYHGQKNKLKMSIKNDEENTKNISKIIDKIYESYANFNYMELVLYTSSYIQSRL